MLILARELRGLNQSEFAKKLKITQGTLSKVEMGILPATDEFIDEISKLLDLPMKFFIREGKIFPPNLYYRKRVRTSRRLQVKDEALMNLHRLNVQSLLKSFDFEHDEMPIFDVELNGSPVNIAKKLRALWRLPAGPIKNIFGLLESKGIIIISCNFSSPDIDGRSMFTDNNDIIIFVNSNKPIDRQRFTLAHELFHILSHIFCNVDDSRDIDKEANLFAGEFLIPENELSKHIFGRVTIETLADLKRYYLVSMQAILMKIDLSGLQTSNQIKYLWSVIAKMGFKKREPRELDPPTESPSLLTRMFKLFRTELDYTDSDFEELLCIKKQEIIELYDINDTPTRLRIVI